MAEVMTKIQDEASNYQKKKTKGKQAIEIKRIENKNARLVAFSKRRKTLFKKLGELKTEYGADFAAIVFSEAGKLHSYGFPNEDAVIQRFINHLDENNDNCDGFWWDKPIDNLGLVELERFKVAIEGLRNEVASKIDEIRCCSESNVYGNFEFGMKMQSNNVMSEVFVPELLPADAFLTLISSKGFF